MEQGGEERLDGVLGIGGGEGGTAGPGVEREPVGGGEFPEGSLGGFTFPAGAKHLAPAGGGKGLRDWGISRHEKNLGTRL